MDVLKNQAGATRVMLVTGHLDNGGGVAVFSELLLSRLSDGFVVDHVEVGARNTVGGEPLEPGAVSTFRRLVLDFVKCARLLHRRKHDVVHLNPSLQTKALLRDGIFLLYLRLIGFRRVVVFYRGWSPDLAERIRRNALLQKAFRLALGWVPCTIVLSETFRHSLTAMGFADASIVTSSTMFDGDAMKNASKTIPDCASSDREPHSLRILFMSRVERNKGIFELIDAIAELATDYPDLQLTVAGDGTALAEAKDHVEKTGMSDHISFTGYVRAPDEKAKMMHNANVFCLPTSHGEGMPVSLLEAMGAGLAVVSTPVGGIPEACGKDGAILVPDPTTAALVQAIRKLKDNPGYCRSLQESNRRRAWGHYEATIVVRNIEALYLAVAGNSYGGLHLASTGTAVST